MPNKTPPAKKALAPKKKVGGSHANQAAPAGLKRYELQRQVIAARASGATWRAIGNTLGIAHTTAMNLCKEGIRENVAENVAELRELEGQRLDKLQEAAWRPALAGDLRAIQTVIRIMDHRAKLFGLFAPVTIDVEATTTVEGAVLVIEGDTKDSYLAGLTQARPLRSV